MLFTQAALEVFVRWRCWARAQRTPRRDLRARLRGRGGRRPSTTRLGRRWCRLRRPRECCQTRSAYATVWQVATIRRTGAREARCSPGRTDRDHLLDVLSFWPVIAALLAMSTATWAWANRRSARRPRWTACALHRSTPAHLVHHAARLRGDVLAGFDAAAADFADSCARRPARLGFLSRPSRRRGGHGAALSAFPLRGGKGLPCSGSGPLRAAIAVFGISPWFWLSFLMLAPLGRGGHREHGDPADHRRRSPPDELRGRMSSVNMIFFMGGRSWERWKPAWWRSCSASASRRVGGLLCRAWRRRSRCWCRHCAATKTDRLEWEEGPARPSFPLAVRGRPAPLDCRHQRARALSLRRNRRHRELWHAYVSTEAFHEASRTFPSLAWRSPLPQPAPRTGHQHERGAARAPRRARFGKSAPTDSGQAGSRAQPRSGHVDELHVQTAIGKMIRAPRARRWAAALRHGSFPPGRDAAGQRRDPDKSTQPGKQTTSPSAPR